MKVDFLIVGHGIAGICVAEHLEQNGATYVVINNEVANSSSKVAAGLYNPITGRKMKKTWLADEIFPYLEFFYAELEKKLQGKFLIKKEIYRPFISIEEQNEWIGSDLAPESGEVNFIKSVATQSKFGDYIEDQYGGLLLKHSGFIDLNSLIIAHKKQLLKTNQYLQGKLAYDQLKISEDDVRYDDIQASNIIFCDGALSENPYFNWVPNAPVKGELLHIQTETPLPEDTIFNRGIFIVKNSYQDFYRVGATYEWRNLDTEPTEKAKLQLEGKLKDLLKIHYKIVDQVAGVRPASKDRKPLIGNHPTLKNVFLFNGLGTKGVSLAPYFANNFCLSIFKKEKLKEEVDISRYYSLYSS
jgi:glycine/D-amino acid oxidase-like deaminating enzyme